MSGAAQFTIAVTIGGKQVYKSFSKSADHPNPYLDVALPAGKAATAWVKSDADTAACDLTAGHGIVTGKVDCYWTESGVAKQRHNVDCTVSTNALALDGGTGDDFPANGNTSVVINSQVTISVACDGDVSVALVACAEFTSAIAEADGPDNYCGLDLRDTGGSTVKFLHLPPNEPLVWWKYCGYTNPLAGNPITTARASNGSATNAATLTFSTLDDSTP